jgi:hypothetical protein
VVVDGVQCAVGGGSVMEWWVSARVPPPSISISHIHALAHTASRAPTSSLPPRQRYDFLVYAYESSIISVLFFPATDVYTRYLATYGIFAAGFIARPAGALFFGWLGDRYSRKTALLASIYAMSVPTFIMGCLPTYASVRGWRGGDSGPWVSGPRLSGKRGSRGVRGSCSHTLAERYKGWEEE